MRIMVVGGSGYLGDEVVRQALGAGHEVVATYLSRPTTAPGVEQRRLDITVARDISAAIDEAHPDAVINAAYRQYEWQPTAIGPANLALAVAAAPHDVHLVHVSSDTVFSGHAPSYAEDAPPDPITPYGAAKAAAETAIGAIVPAAAIVRTSLILGDGRSGHEQFIRALAKGEAEGALFTDEIRCPVHVADLASALLELAAERAGGIFHAAGTDAVSRHELGCLIARRDGLDPEALATTLRADLPTPGPIRLRLDIARTQATLVTRLRGVREFIQ